MVWRNDHTMEKHMMILGRWSIGWMVVVMFACVVLFGGVMGYAVSDWELWVGCLSMFLFVDWARGL